MTLDEFVKTAILCGLASKKIAREYGKGRADRRGKGTTGGADMSEATERNWRDLADAIIIQAATDYRRARYMNIKRPYQANTLREIHSLEKNDVTRPGAIGTDAGGEGQP